MSRPQLRESFVEIIMAAFSSSDNDWILEELMINICKLNLAFGRRHHLH